MGSDCHRCGGRTAHAHLLLLHNQKVLLQEEEEQEREERQGWLQHEEHAGWRGMTAHASYMLISQSSRRLKIISCLFLQLLFLKSLTFVNEFLIHLNMFLANQI